MEKRIYPELQEQVFWSTLENGLTVKIVEGDERNIKVTTPMDLKIAELLLEEME